jgi:hypothetical protein
MLSDFQSTHRSVVSVNEEILHLFVVYLKHGKVYLKSFVCCGKLFNPCENFIAGNRHYADVLAISDLKDLIKDAYHRIRLSSACLAISEQTAVIPLPRVV